MPGELVPTLYTTYGVRSFQLFAMALVASILLAMGWQGVRVQEAVLSQMPLSISDCKPLR
ncbi:hypothetical protein HORIV_60580 [Vreelandella olivaria]|uniref:Uncharacterized protein n=1 Tax=Vreelandella olivaria TaxID=390919 RepID=A0ABM7GSD6_9GAMM|nr:hypothetical protein HORIV_60580 [Halomonas olivaria]